MLPARADDLRRPAGALDPSALSRGRIDPVAATCPRRRGFIKGDAAGEIAAPADGRWTEAIREKYADRVEAILASHIEGFRDNVIARKSYSPADLEALNVNLVGGDPYGGFCGIDQFFLWRPFHGSVNHRTPVARLYHIGASTHPGPGSAAARDFCWRRRWPERCRYRQPEKPPPSRNSRSASALFHALMRDFDAEIVRISR